MEPIIWLVIGIILLAIIGLGWNTFLAGVKKGADKLGLTSVINKAEQSFKNPNSTFQIGSNGHWVSTAKGYSKPSTIKQISVFCQPTYSPTQMFSWNWCVW
jgi:hypothetical protein